MPDQPSAHALREGRKARIAFLTLFPLLAPALCLALEMRPEDLRIGAYVDRGRFQLEDSTVDGEAVNRLGAKWRVEKALGEDWTARLGLHWMFWRNQATDLGLFHIAGLKFDSDLQGSLEYASGPHRLRGGLYDFKYNPDSKNLGEYLLRSEAYPTIVENSQGKDLLSRSFSRIAGLEYGLSYAYFRQTALAFAEQYNIPVNDISFAYLAELGPEPALLRLGVDFHRALKWGKQTRTTVLSQELRDYVDQQGLDARAVKVTAGARADLGALLGLGQDFRIYAEAALLGLKNDSLFYKDPVQRLPVMAGVDLPCFGVLNDLSVEVEYFKNPYYGRKYSISDVTGSNFSPLPYIDDYSQPPTYSRDDWKWSVLARRSLGPWMDLKVRLASDHTRMMDWSGDYVSGEPLTRSTRDWYFLARLEFHD